jgi:hypothetical protein
VQQAAGLADLILVHLRGVGHDRIKQLRVEHLDARREFS